MRDAISERDSCLYATNHLDLDSLIRIGDRPDEILGGFLPADARRVGPDWWRTDTW